MRLARSGDQAVLLRDVVEAAQSGGLLAVVAAAKVVWAVALLCGVAALLTPFPVVPWRDLAPLQEASLGWVCSWHTHTHGYGPAAVASPGGSVLTVLGSSGPGPCPSTCPRWRPSSRRLTRKSGCCRASRGTRWDRGCSSKWFGCRTSWPRHMGPDTRLGTFVVLWGWVAIRSPGGHVGSVVKPSKKNFFTR